MGKNDYDLTDSDNPIGKEWKDQWRAKEKDPSRKRETREEKKAVRRQIHKRDRKKAKDSLKNWNYGAQD